MKILITGITGFIGQNLMRNLLSYGVDVFSIVRDPCDKKSLAMKNVKSIVDDGSSECLLSFFCENRFDGIIHLASKFMVNHSFEDVKDIIESNVIFSSRILESAATSKVKWFINTGTFWQHFNNESYCPVNLYAASKEAFEAISKYYMEVYDINYVTLELTDTYGPGDRRRKIFNIWKDISETGEPLLMSPGEQLIDIVYIDDVVNAYFKTVELVSEDYDMLLKGKTFTVSSGDTRTLKELAIVFSEIVGKPLNIVWGGREYRKREVMIPWDRGEVIPGWSPEISIVEGIKKIIL